MGRGDSHVVEKAKAHGLVPRGVMSGGANSAKSVVGVAKRGEIGGQHGRPRGAARRGERPGIHGCVRIQLRVALMGCSRFNEVYITLRMHPRQAVPFNQRRLMASQMSAQPGGNQPVFYGGKPVRAFRMV